MVAEQVGTDPGGRPLPLAGMRVIELSSYVAAPFAGMTLAQLGAEVLRIDPLGGAPDHRRWPLSPAGKSLYWAGLNKGKRSISLDLRSERGRQIVRELVTAPGAGGGIVVANQRPAWLGHELLQAQRPDVIQVTLEGMPGGGTAVDYTVNARLGYACVTGDASSTAPVNHVFPAWDVIAGNNLAQAVLAAELDRRRTGRGANIRISLWDVALAAASSLGVVAEAELGLPARAADGNAVFGNFGCDFRTADGTSVMVVALTGRHWADLVRVCGAEPLLSSIENSLGVAFEDEEARYVHRELLTAILRPWFAERPYEQVRERLDETSVLWSPFRSFQELVDDPDFGPSASPMMQKQDLPGIGQVSVAGLPWRYADSGHLGSGMPPQLGQDGEAVLEDLLGMTSEGTARLRADGVLG